MRENLIQETSREKEIKELIILLNILKNINKDKFLESKGILIGLNIK
ncbi:TPA: hypothetical protein OLX94_002319 [Clostridioides difficile]|nr:hypothetical protein [Clostridioides difficile]MBJ9769295.1 hypothetical protein [Clostridioides difficile]MCE0686052.1 hypothetical protein [Clostridioides difficile]MCE0713353.1 hypothetical protein [Clostridioides difficile]MCE0720777.1 hypothetical protein [Clostridioides difficile]MCE0730287.1 hypothetical protein [Clostridioides difficile]